MYGLAAYCAIKSLLFTEEHKEICITTELLSYQLSKSLHTKRRFLENIETGYGELIDQLFIKEIDVKSKYRVIDCSKLFINGDNDYFTIVTYEEILKIFHIKSVNSFVLLRYFVFLIGTISSSIDVWLDAFQHKCRVVGNLTIPYLSQISGISEKSINEYNKILENAGLIYINRPNDIIINESSGEIKRMTNIYGRPADKLYIDAFAANQKKYEKSYRYVENNLNKANSKRRLAQIYIQLQRGNDQKYTIAEIKSVFAYVLAENKKYEALYEKNHDHRCLDKIRDTDVFKKYDFYEEEE